MSNLQKIIEENERFESFDSFFAGLSSRNENRAMYLYEKYLQKHIHSSQLRLIEGFREMVREKHRKLLGSVEENDIWRSGYNRAIDDLLSELGDINEIK